MSYNIKRRYIKSIFVVTHNNIFRNGPIGHHTSIKMIKLLYRVMHGNPLDIKHDSVCFGVLRCCY